MRSISPNHIQSSFAFPRQLGPVDLHWQLDVLQRPLPNLNKWKFEFVPNGVVHLMCDAYAASLSNRLYSRGHVDCIPVDIVLAVYDVTYVNSYAEQDFPFGLGKNCLTRFRCSSRGCIASASFF